MPNMMSCVSILERWPTWWRIVVSPKEVLLVLQQGFLTHLELSLRWLFCQYLCEAKVGWDEPLTGHHIDHWNHLQLILREAKPITIPCCVYNKTSQPTKSPRLVGFCDVSSKAYAAVVYVRLEDETGVDVKFLASKSTGSTLVTTCNVRFLTRPH